MKYERQLVLREWGTSGQAALEAAAGDLPCSCEAFVVAERYLHAAGVSSVREASADAPRGPVTMAVDALPWHSSAARMVGAGAACAVDFLAETLREARR